jgi:predicted RNA-binding Zn-ribbon protein involved in translation (DUF1610 family)
MSNHEESGFEKIPETDRIEKRIPCRHSEHNPPTHLYIQEGYQYRHVCPACGEVIIVRAASSGNY